ncbi:GMC family oxidoreductase [Gordonia terrae]|uniref:GMC family oxidoreductase n=1 Tax=Gordonia terrae TaxID=2055 RepID=UPI003F6C2567
MFAARSKDFDYIVVGSGAGGSVVAGRLSEDPRNRVLLIEAGGHDRNPIHLVPKGFYFTMNSPQASKTYTTEPYGDGERGSWPRGRILGGSTTINGMVWNRGWAPDYDSWEELGMKGWNWDRFLTAFTELEDHELGAGPTRGVGGPVPVSITRPREKASDAFIEAMGQHGIEFVDDPNSSDAERVGYVASSIKRGTRMSASRSFLRTARRRANLTIVTNTTAERLVFEGKRAVAVVARGRRGEVTYRAAREVIISGGPLESPQLLERSGVGRPEVLEGAGVRPVVVSPKVGENLREHRGIMFQVELQGVDGFNRQAATFARQMWAGFKYLFTRDGLIAHGGYNIVAAYKSDPASPRPDTHAFFTPISTSAASPTSGRLVVDKFPGARFIVSPTYPTSQGSIHITGPSSDDNPTIIPNYLQTEHDRALIPKVLTKAREILASEPFSRYVVSELEPGPALGASPEAVVDYTINKGVAGIHTLGTCAIGPDDDDVVDDRLRVRGLDNVRVVDSSVFPFMPSGNCSAPTQALAWIAADLIRADNS